MPTSRRQSDTELSRVHKFLVDVEADGKYKSTKKC